MPGGPLCALADLPASGALKLTADIDGEAVSVLVLRVADGVRVFRNLCPHRLSPLDSMPGPLLSDDGRHLQCGMHTALFRIEDGVCVEGPCAGERLIQINAALRDGAVYLLT